MNDGKRLDPREVFRAGARWWAGQCIERVDPDIHDLANEIYPYGEMQPGRDGSWPPLYIGRAFVEGARKQEFFATGATMWQSDQRLAEEEALRRYPLEGV